MIVSDEPNPVTPWISAPTNDTTTMIRYSMCATALSQIKSDYFFHFIAGKFDCQ